MTVPKVPWLSADPSGKGVGINVLKTPGSGKKPAAFQRRVGERSINVAPRPTVLIRGRPQNTTR